MRLEEQYSANQVAGLALSASFWLFISISLVLFPWPDALRNHHKINWLWMSIDITWFLLGIAAAVFMYLALAAFQRGVDAELWDKPSLDRLKARLDNPALTATSWICFGAAFLYFVIHLLTWHIGARHQRPGPGGFAYFWFSPLTALGTLRVALKPKRELSRNTWRDELKPIVSEHWGDRGPVQS